MGAIERMGEKMFRYATDVRNRSGKILSIPDNNSEVLVFPYENGDNQLPFRLEVQDKGQHGAVIEVDSSQHYSFRGTRSKHSGSECVTPVNVPVGIIGQLFAMGDETWDKILFEGAFYHDGTPLRDITILPKGMI